jgi:magnesium and cobalt transporter
MTENEIDQIREDTEDSSELLIIDNVLDLKNLKAMDIMCPRADIIGIEKSESAKSILETMKKCHHAVYPVYNKSLDEVLGVVKANDVFLSMLDSKKIKIGSIMQKCLFVSPAMPVLDLLLKMRLDNINTALVVDEFGGVDGLVSIKDIVEEIVGEIKGVSGGSPEGSMRRHKDGMITLDARMPLEDFEKETGVSLTDDDDIDTVGGVIFDEIGRIPVKGELITLESGVECKIIEANPRTIKTIKIQKIDIEE